MGGDTKFEQLLFPVTLPWAFLKYDRKCSIFNFINKSDLVIK